jgi:hypothetical protein
VFLILQHYVFKGNTAIVHFLMFYDLCLRSKGSNALPVARIHELDKGSAFSATTDRLRDRSSVIV